ncbi:MAG: hypothetical protein J6D03_00460 [Clostridia bacterium]|nr:hypothetical protein [Clostridia bacterium]
MANTIDSKEKLKEIGGLNFGEQFKVGGPTSPLSIEYSVIDPGLEESIKAKKKAIKDSWEAEKRKKKRKEDRKNNAFEAKDLIKKAKDTGETIQSMGGPVAAASTILNAPATIMNAGVVGAGQIAGSVIGGAGALYGRAVGSIQMIEGTASFAVDLVTQTIEDVTTYALTSVADRIIDVIKPPSIGEITSKAAKVAKDYVAREMKEEVKELLVNKEEQSEKKQKTNIIGVINNVTTTINNTTSKIKGYVDGYIEGSGNDIKMIQGYMGLGKDWLSDRCNEYSEDAKAVIAEYIDDQAYKILSRKQQTVDNLATSLGESMGKKIVNIQRELVKKQTDAIREKTNNVTIKAKAKVGKALLNLWAKVGA